MVDRRQEEVAHEQSWLTNRQFLQAPTCAHARRIRKNIARDGGHVKCYPLAASLVFHRFFLVWYFSIHPGESKATCLHMPLYLLLFNNWSGFVGPGPQNYTCIIGDPCHHIGGFWNGAPRIYYYYYWRVCIQCEFVSAMWEPEGRIIQ